MSTLSNGSLVLLSWFRHKVTALLIIPVAATVMVSCSQPRTGSQNELAKVTITAIANGSLVMNPDVATALAAVTPAESTTPLLRVTTTNMSPPTASLALVTSTCEPPQGWVIYTIRPLDTLLFLASQTGVTEEAIKAANCVEDDQLVAYEELYLPSIPPTFPTVTPTPTPVPPTPIPPAPAPVVINPAPNLGSPGGGAGSGPPGLDDLREEIFFSFGGEDDVLGRCQRSEGLEGTTFEITIKTFNRLGDICLYDYPLGENITINLYKPGGELAESTTFVNGTNPSTQYLSFAGWPYGQWSAEVKSSSAGVKKKNFNVERSEYPFLTTAPPENFLICPSTLCFIEHEAGESLSFTGEKLPPGPLALGIYQRDNSNRVVGTLIDTLNVFPNKHGSFSDKWDIPDLPANGNYCAVVVVEPSILDDVALMISFLSPSAIFPDERGSWSCFLVR